MGKLIFGLGVLLGVLSPAAVPLMSARAFRQGETLYLSVELSGAFDGSAREAAASGSEVAFELEARLLSDDPGARLLAPVARARRSLRRDAATGRWVAAGSPGLEPRAFDDPEGAAILASRVWALELSPLASVGAGAELRVVARPGIVDAAGVWHPAAILWGYAEPLRVLKLRSAAEVPQ